MENRRFRRKTVASFQSFLYHARAENATYMSFSSMRISHSLPHWMTAGSSTSARNPSLLPSSKVILHRRSQNQWLMPSSLMAQLWWTVCAHERQKHLKSMQYWMSFLQYKGIRPEDRHCVWCLSYIKSESWNTIKARKGSQTQSNQQWENSIKLAKFFERKW